VLVARHALAEKARQAAFARVRDLLNRRQQRLDDLTHRLALVQREQLLRIRRRLDAASTRLQHHDLLRSLQRLRSDMDARTASMTAAVRNLLFRRRSRLEQSVARLESLSPLSVLERGYALVFDAAGQLVKSADQLREADEIRARLAHGSFTAKVTSRQSE
jgi:exodeoxyribonuclease VII large subunit